MRICDPQTTDCNSLARFLYSYGLDLDLDINAATPLSIQMLFEPGCMQAYIDRSMHEKNRHGVCQLLFSWHIPCTLSRLEMVTADVVRCFKSCYVTKEPNKEAMFDAQRIVDAISGDVDAIKETWPDEDVPGYVSLHRHRMHLFTLLNLCAMMDVEKFQLLYVTAFGPASPRKKKHRHQKRGQSIRELVIGIVAKHEKDINEKAQHNSQAEEIRNRLVTMNADVDVGLCEICMDKPISVRFEPCLHNICCDGCAALISVCCICRAEICGHQVFVAEKDETRMAPKPKSPVSERDDELYFSSICLLLERLETGERIKLRPCDEKLDEMNKNKNKKGKKKKKKK